MSELWIAIRGVYADARPIGVASSREAARDMVRAAIRADYPDGVGDPLDDWMSGSVDGPYRLDKLRPEPY
jgi:hypothetical protein